VTKLQKLETEEKRRVRGATPEEELKAKQLSDRAHAEATLQSNYKFASENSEPISPQRHKEHQGRSFKQEVTEETEVYQRPVVAITTSLSLCFLLLIIFVFVSFVPLW